MLQPMLKKTCNINYPSCAFVHLN